MKRSKLELSEAECAGVRHGQGLRSSLTNSRCLVHLWPCEFELHPVEPVVHQGAEDQGSLDPAELMAGQIDDCVSGSR